MHDSTRRIICRLAFVALCVVPCGTLSAWIAYRATPIHARREHASWTDAIYESSGLLAEVDEVKHPTQSRTILEGLTLRDPDSDRIIARIRILEFAETDQGIVAIASQPEVEPNEFQRLGRLLQQRVLRGPRPQRQFQLLTSELTIHGDEMASTARDVRCLVASSQDRVEVTMDFTLAGFDMQNSAQIQILRERGIDQTSTAWHVRTGGTALPCALLADYIPGLRSLGNRSRFQGTAWVDQVDLSWDGELAGQFLDVNLDQLVAPFPHKLSGSADITLSHTKFHRGKLVEAAGSISSAGGVISQSLLAAAAESLKLASPVTRDEHADTLRDYQQLALGFQIDNAGLQLFGLCEDQREGALLIARSGEILLEARDETIQTIALARTLVPDSELLVPATTATETLLRVLPLPSVTPRSSGSARLPYSPLRLR